MPEVLFVTGGCSGIGQELARQFVERYPGCKLAIFNRTANNAALVKLEALAGHGNVAFYCVDVSDFDALREAVNLAVDQVGHPSLAFHAAGIQAAGEFMAQPREDFLRVINVNFIGTECFARAIIPHLRPGSHLALVASMAGLAGTYAYSAYTASKHAVVGLASCLRQELLPQDIAVSAICPGEIHTPMVVEERKTIHPITAQLKDIIPTMTVENAVEDMLNQLATRRFMIVPGARARLIARLLRWAPGIINSKVDSTIRSAATLSAR